MLRDLFFHFWEPVGRSVGLDAGFRQLRTSEVKALTGATLLYARPAPPDALQTHTRSPPALALAPPSSKMVPGSSKMISQMVLTGDASSFSLLSIFQM